MCPEKGTLKKIVKNNPHISFADLMDGLRRAKNVNIKDLMEDSGISVRNYSRYGSQEIIPSKRTAITIGVVLGLNIDELHYFLALAGYVLSPRLLVDNAYTDAIQKNKGDGSSRIINCNLTLAKHNIEEKYLLGR